MPNAIKALQTVILIALPAFAQGPPPLLPPGQLDRLVDRVALYPDPLLAQIFAAATFPDQIPDAARWADQHHYMTGQALANAIQADQLPWDPAVQALLPFPSVLDMIASDMNWTSQIGNAFLTQQQDVMDAVQRERQKAKDFGYLRGNGQIVVAGGPYITILPVDPGFVVVPYYDPAIVFFPAAPRFLHWRGDSLWLWRVLGSLLPAMGLGLQPLRLGRPCDIHQQRTMAAHLGDPVHLRPSVHDPEVPGTAGPRAA